MHMSWRHVAQLPQGLAATPLPWARAVPGPAARTRSADCLRWVIWIDLAEPQAYPGMGSKAVTWQDGRHGENSVKPAPSVRFVLIDAPLAQARPEAISCYEHAIETL